MWKAFELCYRWLSMLCQPKTCSVTQPGDALPPWQNRAFGQLLLYVTRTERCMFTSQFLESGALSDPQVWTEMSQEFR